jgi:hypothetical protein
MFEKRIQFGNTVFKTMGFEKGINSFKVTILIVYGIDSYTLLEESRVTFFDDCYIVDNGIKTIITVFKNPRRIVFSITV